MLEESNKSALAQLQETRSTVNRQSTELAKSVGWESRLNRVTQERDDMHQERDEAVQRTRVAEARLTVLENKCGMPFGSGRVLVAHQESNRQDARAGSPPTG